MLLTRDTLPERYRPPVMDMAPRILHFGLGAFHRAHQAVWTENVAARTGEPWGIVAVAPRSRETVAKLRAQDNLYTVTVRGGDSGVRVCGALTGTLHLGDDADAVSTLLTAPETAVITLTVTEKGYFRTPEGHLDLETDHGGTAIGALTRGLAARHRAGGPPIASCGAPDRTAAPGLDRERAARGLGRDRGAVALTRCSRHPSPVAQRIID